jgi:hypothetical protein
MISNRAKLFHPICVLVKLVLTHRLANVLDSILEIDHGQGKIDFLLHGSDLQNVNSLG